MYVPDLISKARMSFFFTMRDIYRIPSNKYNTFVCDNLLNVYKTCPTYNSKCVSSTSTFFRDFGSHLCIDRDYLLLFVYFQIPFKHFTI